MLCRRHEPRTRVVRDTRLRPPLERGHQRVLRQILRQPHVAREAGQAGNELRRLDPPHRIDRPVDVRHSAGRCQRRFWFAISARTRASRAFVSGVMFEPKSSSSNTWRISTSPSLNGARFNHSIASSFDFTLQIQKPAMSSLVSANGPSMTFGLPSPNRTRAPFALACSPSPSSITPAFANSSLNFVISVSSCAVGSLPDSLSALAFTMIMNRMAVSPSQGSSFTVERWWVERAFTISTSEGGYHAQHRDPPEHASRNGYVLCRQNLPVEPSNIYRAPTDTRAASIEPYAARYVIAR